MIEFVLPLYNPIPVCSNKDAAVMSLVDYCIAWPQVVFITICHKRDNASGYRTQILIKIRKGVPELGDPALCCKSAIDKKSV